MACGGSSMIKNDLLGMFGGLKVIEAREFPVLSLSPDVPVSDAFRSGFNLWLLSMFGTRSVLPRGQAILMQNMCLVVMRPEQIARLQNIIA